MFVYESIIAIVYLSSCIRYSYNIDVKYASSIALTQLLHDRKDIWPNYKGELATVGSTDKITFIFLSNSISTECCL